MGGELTIRPASPSDAAILTVAWIEFGREYAALDPVRFKVPEEREEWVKSELKAVRSDDETWLVAERDGAVVGYLHAEITRPVEDAGRQLLRDLAEPVLKINALLVFEDQRRIGIGTALMGFVEEWAKGQGATRAFLNAYSGSPTAVPFYEERMGYLPMVLGFWKQL